MVAGFSQSKWSKTDHEEAPISNLRNAMLQFCSILLVTWVSPLQSGKGRHKGEKTRSWKLLGAKLEAGYHSPPSILPSLTQNVLSLSQGPRKSHPNIVSVWNPDSYYPNQIHVLVKLQLVWFLESSNPVILFIWNLWMRETSCLAPWNIQHHTMVGQA